jgi:hypothetical protein
MHCFPSPSNFGSGKIKNVSNQGTAILLFPFGKAGIFPSISVLGGGATGEVENTSWGKHCCNFVRIHRLTFRALKYHAN